MDENAYRTRRELQERAAAEKADSLIAKGVHGALAEKCAASEGDEAQLLKVARDVHVGSEEAGLVSGEMKRRNKDD